MASASKPVKSSMLPSGFRISCAKTVATSANTSERRVASRSAASRFCSVVSRTIQMVCTGSEQRSATAHILTGNHCPDSWPPLRVGLDNVHSEWLKAHSDITSASWLITLTVFFRSSLKRNNTSLFCLGPLPSFLSGVKHVVFRIGNMQRILRGMPNTGITRRTKQELNGLLVLSLRTLN